MKLVVYDEFEKFHSYKEPLFNYPYEKRKNTIGSFHVEFDFEYDDRIKNYKYEFQETILKFRKS